MGSVVIWSEELTLKILLGTVSSGTGRYPHSVVAIRGTLLI
jgi:hypothetical protein